jgi:hypothetical protein
MASAWMSRCGMRMRSQSAGGSAGGVEKRMTSTCTPQLSPAVATRGPCRACKYSACTLRTGLQLLLNTRMNMLHLNTCLDPNQKIHAALYVLPISRARLYWAQGSTQC